ncbi:MAG: hypothetical protein ABSB82_01330 [Terriglobia bacterium]|jgi:hypothetical protein
MRKPHSTVTVLLLIGLSAAVGSLSAQETGRAKTESTTAAAPAQSTARPRATHTHKFWDEENVALFTGVALARGFDYSSTQHFRERRVNEVLLTNSIVDNKPLFAGIELAGTAVSVAVSYWCHHKGHHRAERWVSIVHVGVGTFGDIRNYGLSNLNRPGKQ